MAANPEQIEAMRRMMALVGIGRAGPSPPVTVPSDRPRFRVLMGDDLARTVARVAVGIPEERMPAPGVLEQIMQAVHAGLWVASANHRSGFRSGAVTAAAGVLVNLDGLADLGSEEAVAALQYWSDAFVVAGIGKDATTAARTMRERV